MRSVGVWLPVEGEQGWVAAGWLTRPDRSPASAGPGAGIGVVMVPPVGYERSSSYHLWRRLAEVLAERGCQCLRIDPPGSGDSAGLDGQVSSVSMLGAPVDAAARRLRAAGCSRVAVVGGQLGAMVALLGARRIDAGAVVGVLPVLSGGRYVRQLQLMGLPFPDGSGNLAVAGTVFSSELLRDIAGTDLTGTDLARPVLLAVTNEARAEKGFAGAQTGEVDVALEESLRDVFERPAEEAVVDPAVVDRMAGWIVDALPGSPDGAGRADSQPDVGDGDGADGGDGTDDGDGVGDEEDSAAVLRWREAAVTERFVTVGPDRLAGVLTAAPDAGGHDEIVVFLNSGSDPHAGPARAWVEFARDLALTGRRATLRVDLRGWGETPRDGGEPGRPYDDSAVPDTRRLVTALHEQGWSRVVLAGLCAGAWVALHVARETRVEGVVALNPQLYWQPGDPVEALMSTTRARRMPEIEQIRAVAATGRWDDEDRRGIRPPAGHWLDDLAASGARITMVFTAGDDGLEYLQDRLGRRLAAACASGRVTVVEVPDVDHGMHRAWRRPAVLEAMATALDTMGGVTDGVTDGVTSG